MLRQRNADLVALRLKDLYCTGSVPPVQLTFHAFGEKLRRRIDSIIDLITKYKCDSTVRTTWTSTPLHYAASNNHLEVVRYFSNEQHCDPMTKDNNGDTPLNLACRNGHLNIAEYLIFEAHCRYYIVNNEGPRLLHPGACHIGTTSISPST